MTSKRIGYASGTGVPVERSKGEVSGILASHGVTHQAWAMSPDRDVLTFLLDGRRYQFDVERPTWADVARNYVNTKTPAQQQAAADAEHRRRWRVLVLLLKAKMEQADGGATTPARELLPYLVLQDGQTLGAWVEDHGDELAQSTLPLLTAGKVRR